MIKVGIIDDGVDYATGLNIVKSIQIDEDLKVKEISKLCDIKSIHGKYCALILDKYYKKVEYYSIKILKYRLGCNRKQLIKSIEWCIENDIKVINMSLGTINYKDFEDIRKAIDRAYYKGVIIVAACNNNNVFTYPASNKKVIGVKSSGKLKEGEYKYNLYPLDGIEITACGSHNLTSFKKKMTLCNSYAAPMITAKVCAILEEYPYLTFEEIKENLYKYSINYNKEEYLLYNPCEIENYYNCKRKEINVPLVFVVSENKHILNTVIENLNYNFRKDGYYSIFKNINENSLGAVKNAEILKEKLEKLYRVYDCDIFLAGVGKRMDFIREIKKVLNPDKFIFLAEKEDLNNKEMQTLESLIINTKECKNSNEIYEKLLRILL